MQSSLSFLANLPIWVVAVLMGLGSCFSVDGAQENDTRTHYLTVASDEPAAAKIDFFVRWGEGGFKDGRSPLGELGGGQLALDIKPIKWPIALSISGEFYTNSPDPTHPYEISDMMAVNVLYTEKLFSESKADYFVGGGLGRLKVPRSEDTPGVKAKAGLYNLEAGLHVKSFKRVGFYGVAKYLYAQKKVGNIRLIDFKEHILMFGVTFRFSL